MPEYRHFTLLKRCVKYCRKTEREKMDKTEELFLAVLNMGLKINNLYEHLGQLTERVIRIEEQIKERKLKRMKGNL
jgi:hypothetical protein